MKKPDRFERMVEQLTRRPNDHYRPYFSRDEGVELLRRLYTQIRREIRRVGIQPHPCGMTPNGILTHLDRWRRGKR